MTSMPSKSIETFKWDIVDHLQTEEDRIAYLIAALEEGDPTLIAAAVDDITRAVSQSFDSDPPRLVSNT